MANIALSTLLPLISLPRCPENTILQALREASRIFLTETEIWREEISFTTVTDQTNYTLTNSYSAIAFVWRIVSVEVETETDDWTFDRPTSLTFSSAPNGGIASTALAVFVPTTLHAELPDWIINIWGIAIAHGATYLLKAKSGSNTDPLPWSDLNGAAIERNYFYSGINSAKLEVFSKRKSGDPGIQMREF